MKCNDLLLIMDKLLTSVYIWVILVLVRQVYLLIRFHEKATGGGAYKFADVFKERLGVSLDKEDEMDCLVAGANFLLKVCFCQLLLLSVCIVGIVFRKSEKNVIIQ